MKHNGFSKVWHIEGGIIEYARKAREQGLPVRFVGKTSFLTSVWVKEFLKMSLRIAINAERRATAIPIAKMMAAICCLSSARPVRKI